MLRMRELTLQVSKTLLAWVVAALVALSLGVAVYLFDRLPDDVYLMAPWMELGEQAHPVFGTAGNYLPTFSHVYVFILLTAALAASSLRSAVIICVAWLVIDIAFELAQLPVVAQALTEFIPGWFSGIPVLENVSNYFLSGTFDVLDIVSIAAGALTAYLTIFFSFRRATEDD